MGRLVDIDAVRNAIQEEWGGVVGRYRALDIIDDTTHAVEQVETVEAISIDWIRSYIDHLKKMGVQMSLRDAQAVSVMVDKYMMDQTGAATCGPDYCDL